MSHKSSMSVTWPSHCDTEAVSKHRPVLTNSKAASHAIFSLQQAQWIQIVIINMLIFYAILKNALH